MIAGSAVEPFDGAAFTVHRVTFGGHQIDYGSAAFKPTTQGLEWCFTRSLKQRH